MDNDNLLWKDERIRALKESLAFFSNKEKLNREKWTVCRLLRALGIDFNEKELNAAEEPVDVAFRDMRFQEKEIVDKNRRRTDEYKKALEIAEAAQNYSELLEMYDPIDISFSEVVQECYEYANNLLLKSKYGPHECKNIDLICYFNLVNHFIVPPTQFEIKELAFRSLSVVSNRYCVVAYAKEDAPIILRNNLGITKDYFEV